MEVDCDCTAVVTGLPRDVNEIRSASGAGSSSAVPLTVYGATSGVSHVLAVSTSVGSTSCGAVPEPCAKLVLWYKGCRDSVPPVGLSIVVPV